MAKRKLIIALSDMEEALGYTVQSRHKLPRTEVHCYSDLRPVPDICQEEMERDIEAYHRLRHGVSRDRICRGSLPGLAVREVSKVRIGICI